MCDRGKQKNESNPDRNEKESLCWYEAPKTQEQKRSLSLIQSYIPIKEILPYYIHLYDLNSC